MLTTSTLRSSRVKSISFSPLPPFRAAIALYTGEIQIFDTKQQKIIASREVTSSPIRTIFYAPPYILTGSDDGYLRILQETTLSLIQETQISTDYIRQIIVQQQLIFTASDDGILRIFKFQDQLSLMCETIPSSGFLMSISIFGSKVASCGQKGDIKVYDFENENFVVESESQLNLAHKLAQSTISLIKKEVHFQGGKKQIISPMFTIKGDTCCNSICWVDCPKISGNDQRQFLAVGNDENQVIIYDSFTKGIVAKFDDFTEPVSQVYYSNLQQQLFVCSEDNSMKIYDLMNFELIRTLQYNMERSWCISGVQDQSQLILGVGFDQGTVFAKIGENQSVYDFYAGKFAFLGKNEGEGYKIQNGSGVSILNQKNEVKSLDIDNGNQIEFLPNGKLIKIQNGLDANVYSVQTGKLKMNQKCKQMSFGRDFKSDKFVYQSYNFESQIEENGIYSVIINNSVSIMQNGDTLMTLDLDFTPMKIFSGPLLFIAGKENLSIFDFNGKFIAQLEMSATDIIFNESGEIFGIMTEQQCYIGKIDVQLINESEDNPIDGIEDGIEIFSELQNVTSMRIGDKIVVFQIFNDIFQIFIDEMMEGEGLNLKVETQQTLNIIEILDIVQNQVIVLTEKENLYQLTKLSLDVQIVEFRTIFAQNQNKAFEYSRLEFNSSLSKVSICADFLFKNNNKDKILELSTDHDINSQLCIKFLLLDSLLSFALQSQNFQILSTSADLFFRSGYICNALEIYKLTQNEQMQCLCSYILGDKNEMENLTHSTNLDVQFRAKSILSQNISSLLHKQNEKAAFTQNEVDIQEWKNNCKRGQFME